MTPKQRVGRVRPANHPRGQRGMVTVELALGSLAAALVLVMLSWVLAVVMLWGTCNELATAVARQASRGDQAAIASLERTKPSGARIEVRQQADQITVVVRLAAQPWASWLPVVPLQAEATVIREPS